jgi:predicted HicB family RNase H-like nuclease
MPGAQDALRKAKRTRPLVAAEAAQFIKAASDNTQPETEAIVPPWETVEEELSEKGKPKRVSFPLRLNRRDNAMLDWVAQELEISKNQLIRQFFLRTKLPEVAQELWDKKMSL